ncbi:hypothetical protein TESG_03378 [Trichophyton tonsurans CBS 112818]|uniref:Uncharacterized protein n=1 Tax=Trichophyton tonsurans (strain CBS 112818) TaxID=647933 RepID=F2RXD1_TRIT1|nr:hypothetical protein TESG_03378 [Trichophyton tonsurans CBS 112818]
MSKYLIDRSRGNGDVKIGCMISPAASHEDHRNKRGCRRFGLNPPESSPATTGQTTHFGHGRRLSASRFLDTQNLRRVVKASTVLVQQGFLPGDSWYNLDTGCLVGESAIYICKLCESRYPKFDLIYSRIHSKIEYKRRCGAPDIIVKGDPFSCLITVMSKQE